MNYTQKQNAILSEPKEHAMYWAQQVFKGLGAVTDAVLEEGPQWANASIQITATLNGALAQVSFAFPTDEMPLGATSMGGDFTREQGVRAANTLQTLIMDYPT